MCKLIIFGYDDREGEDVEKGDVFSRLVFHLLEEVQVGPMRKVVEHFGNVDAVSRSKKSRTSRHSGHAVRVQLAPKVGVVKLPREVDVVWEFGDDFAVEFAPNEAGVFVDV